MCCELGTRTAESRSSKTSQRAELVRWDQLRRALGSHRGQHAHDHVREDQRGRKQTTACAALDGSPAYRCRRYKTKNMQYIYMHIIQYYMKGSFGAIHHIIRVLKKSHARVRQVFVPSHSEVQIFSGDGVRAPGDRKTFPDSNSGKLARPLRVGGSLRRRHLHPRLQPKTLRHGMRRTSPCLNHHKNT